jgi:hypothetical protein
VFTLRFSPTGSLGFWLGVHYRWDHGGGGFFCFAGFSQVSGFEDVGSRAFLGDPKGKLEIILRGKKRRQELEAKGHHFLGALGSSNDGTKPSEECKAAMFQALYKWFKETPFININKKNLALGEVVGKEAFLSHMWRLFEDAISGDEWDEDKPSLATPNGWRTSLWMRCTTLSQFLIGTGNSRQCQ